MHIFKISWIFVLVELQCCRVRCIWGKNAILDGCSTVDSKLDYDGIRWYSMVFDGIAWYSMVFCYSIVFIGIQWYCMVYDGIAGFYMVFDGIQ